MRWIDRLLCALGWPPACPPPARHDPEREEKRAVLEHAVARHRLDDDGEDERLAAIRAQGITARRSDELR